MYGASLIEYKRGVMRNEREIALIKDSYHILNEKILGFDFTLDICVKGETIEQLEINISKLTKELQTCDLNINEHKFIYKAVMTNEDVGEYVIDTLEDKDMSVVRYTLFCIDKFDLEKVIEFSDNTTIELDSTLKTPVTVEITPTIALIDLTIKGLGGDIKINNLSANKTITLKDGLVLEGSKNKFTDYDSWVSVPFLVPGKNLITVDKKSCNIKVKYNPRWI